MSRIFFLALSFCLFTTISAQQTPADSLSKMATVDVTVTNMKGQPMKGEQVIFRGLATGKLLSGVSDAAGKIKQLLPPGDTYNVSLKSISDTTKYASLVIPALEADEYFTDPFWVNIKFEPVRNYRLDNVHFDTDKATLRPDSYKQLAELLDYLQRHENIKAEIAGHTDNTGTDSHNKQLSQDRANTIRQYLVSKGIKADRLTAKGYGASQPVADNTTTEGRQLNRRTEVRIL